MNQMKTGQFIAKLRKEHGFLQKDIAERLGVSEKTISKWECGNGLPEVVYMEPLCEILGITVNELLAGEHIPILELIHTLDTTRLELVRQLEFEQLKMRLYKLYDIEIDTMETFDNGAGGLTYLVSSGTEKFVVKYPSDNEMNHTELEARVCRKLLRKGIPACDFITNKQGTELSEDETGRRFTVQKYYEGKTYQYHEAPVCLQEESAAMLAKIHIAMKDMEELSTGIGQAFFQYRKPENMGEIYRSTLKNANDQGHGLIAEKICSNMRIAESFPKYSFDINRFSVGNSHGDYNISQLIWKDEKIAGVIDWTCACKQPYIWEIVRSYVFMAPECREGSIDIDGLIAYIKTYMQNNSLNAYDIENAGKLFYYFLTVCDFYGQYYASLTKNRNIYLQQANMASGLLIWFEKHIDELNARLAKISRQPYGGGVC